MNTICEDYRLHIGTINRKLKQVERVTSVKLLCINLPVVEPQLAAALQLYDFTIPTIL